MGSEQWGLAVCTIDGQRFSIGDAEIPFTLQSTSQAITYGICLSELGEGRVHQYQGREPSGRNFNEIALDHHGNFKCFLKEDDN
jgi:glutaminase